MARRDKIVGQFAWISGGKVLAALIQAVTIVLLARAVTPTEFGFFSAAYGTAAVAQTFFDLGLPTLVILERAKNSNAGIVTAALRLNNSLSLLMTCLLLVLTATLGFAVDTRFFLLLPLAVWAAAERNADAWLGVVFADGDAKINTANLVARRAGNLLLFGLLAFGTAIDPVLAFAISSATAACVSWAFAHVYVARRLPQAAKVSASSLLRESWPFWLDSVATQARNLDVALTSFVAGAAQAGYYAAASRLANPLLILPTSLAIVLLPASSRRTSTTMRGVLKLVIIMVAGLAVVFTLLAAAVPAAVPAILGQAYVGAVVPLQITAVGLIFASISSLLGSLLQGVGLKNYVAMTAVITTCTCLLGVGLGGHTLGATGAAVGLVFSYLLQSAMVLARISLFVVRKEPNL